MLQSALPPLDDTLGAIEIGGVVGTFLFGIGTLQTFYYYGHFPADSKLLKSAVGLLWILELGHTISTWHTIYSVTVTFYGQSQYIKRPPHSLDMVIVFSALIYFIVQVFFAHRIRKLSGRWEITIICWVLAFLRAGCAFGSLGITLHVKQLSELQEKYKFLAVSTLSLGASVDVIISVSISYLLWTMRTSGVNETRRMVDTLVLWTIESGMATGGTSVIIIILFVLRNDLTWVAFNLILAKLFSNSFLASLNGRRRFRVLESGVVNLDTGHPSFNPSHLIFGPQSKMGTALEISTRRHSVADFGSSKDVERGKHFHQENLPLQLGADSAGVERTGDEDVCVRLGEVVRDDYVAQFAHAVKTPGCT
ncbi:hypothetical protein C8J57DRAFT_1492454 [Mycena rebaudengoi]|nr:hypothetical protein C8J57DRAFT_1492454 [Mycena rebaudengoi]